MVSRPKTKIFLFSLLIANYWINEIYLYLLITSPKIGKFEIIILFLLIKA